tara:strand:+ start:3892 stop:4872 length:981 start_codon:yes stop_codon:yes gene_type:complete
MSEVENLEATQNATVETEVVQTPEVEAPAEVESTTTVSAEEPKQVEVAPGTDRFNTLMKTLGDVPDAPNEQLISGLDEKSLESLPDSAKGMLKHLMAQQKSEHQKQIDSLKKQNESLGQRETRIKAEARKLIQNRAELNRVLLDPKFQAFLQQANMPEEKMADPFTKEGMEQRIQKSVAEAMNQFQKPITEAAEKARQMNAYTEFVESNPKMKEKTFKRDVLSLMEEREKQDRPVSISDAYQMVELDKMKQAEEARKNKEMKARAKSNRKINRATMSSNTETGDPVPKWVTEKGYNGARGHSARIMYLRDNPKALARLREQQKSRR